MGKVFARKIMETADNSFTIANVPNLWLPKTIEAFKDFVKSREITEIQYEIFTGQKYIA